MINNNRQTTVPPSGSADERLPELPFLQFTVSGENKDSALGPAHELVGKEKSFCLRYTHPQRACICVRSRSLYVRMAGQTAEAPQPMNFLEWNNSQCSLSRI